MSTSLMGMVEPYPSISLVIVVAPRRSRYCNSSIISNYQNPVHEPPALFFFLFSSFCCASMGCLPPFFFICFFLRCVTLPWCPPSLRHSYLPLRRKNDCTERQTHEEADPLSTITTDDDGLTVALPRRQEPQRARRRRCPRASARALPRGGGAGAGVGGGQGRRRRRGGSAAAAGRRSFILDILRSVRRLTGGMSNMPTSYTA